MVLQILLYIGFFVGLSISASVVLAIIISNIKEYKGKEKDSGYKRLNFACCAMMIVFICLIGYGIYTLF